MKKALSVILAMVMVLSVFAVLPVGAAQSDLAESELILSQDGEYWYSGLGDGTVQIEAHKYKDYLVDYVTVPSKIDGYTVSRIAENAFAYTRSRVYVIPSCVTGRWFASGFNSAYNENNAKPVILYERITPDSHHVEGSNVFPRYEYHLLEDGTACLDVIRPTSIVPDTLWDGTKVSAIAPGAFQPIDGGRDVYSLDFSRSKIKIEPVLDTVPDKLFDFDRKSVTLNITGDTVLYDDSLSKRSGMTLNIVGDSDIPDEYLLNKKAYIENLNIGGNIKRIGKMAFTKSWDDVKIDNITIKGNVKHIDEMAFGGCTVKNLTLESGIQSIGDMALYGCKNLTTVTVPRSVTEIGDKALGYYQYLSGLEILDLKVSGFRIYGYKGSAAEKYANDNKILFVPIEVQTGTAGECTWEYDPGSGTFTVSGEGSFEYDESLEDYIWEAESFIVEDGVTGIGDSIMLNSDKLRRVVLPGSVKEIGEDCFQNCENLESVTLAEGLETIGSGVFNEIPQVSEITVPGSVKTIGDGAFGNNDEGFKLIVSAGSAAETYAKANGIEFEKTAGGYIRGDVDKSGKVNVFDASYILKGTTGTKDYPDYKTMDKDSMEFKRADVDASGTVNIFDAAIVLKHATGDKSVEKYGVGREVSE